MVCYHVYISGKVQGVFFRASCKKKADCLGVSGWIKNLPNGRVEAVFEGEKEKVYTLIMWCLEGPPQADVSSIKIEKCKSETKIVDSASFVIRY